MYDFDTFHSREGYASIKWDLIPKKDQAAGIVPLSVADMEFPTAPEIIEDVMEYAQKGLWGYTWADESYQETVKKWMKNQHNWEIQTEWITPTPGVVTALYTAVRAYSKPDDKVIIQPPVYHPFFDAVTNNNRVVVENPLVLDGDHYKMNLNELKTLAKEAKMLILCSPHNPVGRVWREDELLSLAKICEENQITVISDEIHSDIIMSGHKHFTYGRLGDKYLDNSIIATSASKTFSLAGLSCSNLIIKNSELKEKFEKQMAKDGCHFNSAFGVVATRSAYTRGLAWMEGMLTKVEENYHLVKRELERFAPHLKVTPMEGTYLCWVDCRALGMGDEELKHFMEDGVKIYANSGISFGAQGEGFVRLNLAAPTSVIVAALERWESGMENLDK